MDKIEILPVSLLEKHRSRVQSFMEISNLLEIGLGWHYLLDLTWVAQQVHAGNDMRVMDAGAGSGIMQWWLAQQGTDVISVDRLSRQGLPTSFRKRYRIRGVRKEDLTPENSLSLSDFLPSSSPLRWYLYPQKIVASIRRLQYKLGAHSAFRGTVYIYNHDLRSMPDISDESVDGIVSISSLEHNSPEGLKSCVTELMRVLRPGGKIIATMAAAKEKDWFHNPSKGWCYTEATLREIFDLSPDCLSNYDKYDELFEELRNCDELRGNLADFYFQSGNNGMPWGLWDPKYQPVGIVRTKI